MQAVRDAGRVAQVVVVVQYRVGQGLGHVADLLGLRHDAQHAMLDVLQDVRHAVRTVQVHIALLLADKGLVPLRMELLPQADQILDHADVRAGLDIEIPGIEIAAYIQARDEFQRLVLGIGRRPLAVLVEVVGVRRSLEVALFERLAMPEPVAFIDCHMVHVHRDPDIACRYGNPVIDRRIDDEIISLYIPVAQVIDSAFLNRGEIESGIVVFEIGAPFLDRTGEDLADGPVGFHLPDGSLRPDLVLLVQFDDGHLGLVGHIAHLGETHIGLADPSFHGIRFDGPGHDLARLPRRQEAPDDHPAILGQHPSVIELEQRVLRSNLDHPLRRIRRQEQFVASLQRKRLDEHPGSPVVIGPVPMELQDFLFVRTKLGVADRIPGNPVRPVVHQVRLAPILRRQELQHETGLADQFLRDRFVQEYGDFHGLAFGPDRHPGVKVIVIVPESDFDASAQGVYHTVRHFRDEVPLLRCCTQADGAALESTDSVVDDFNTGVLFVIETAGKGIVENQDIDTLSLEITQVVQFQVFDRMRASGGRQQGRQHQANAFHVLLIMGVPYA